MTTTPMIPQEQIKAIDGLLRLLVPRATSFAVYDTEKRLIWRSGNAHDSAAESVMARLSLTVDADGQYMAMQQTLKSGDVLFVVPMPPVHGKCPGLMAVDYPTDGKSVTPPSLDMLSNLVRPALQIISEALATQKRYAADNAVLMRAAAQLDVIYSLDEQLKGAPHGRAGLVRLIGTAARHLQAGYCVLRMPGKQIRISVTHPKWKSVDRAKLDKAIVQHFIPENARQDKTTVLNVAKSPPGLKTPMDDYNVVLCPVREGDARISGVIAVMGQVDNIPFSDNDLRFLELISREVEKIVERNYDRLTGLMNRQGFESHLRSSYEQLNEYDDAHCLVYFDIDKLQLVNDTFNHKAGDEVLVRFANELVQLLPKDGVASRIAGDNFAVLLPNAPLEAGAELAESMRLRAHKMSYLKGDKSHRITVSAGVAAFVASDEGYSGAMITPKVACTAAKDHGRDRVEVYDQQNFSIVRRVDDMQIVGQIHNALDRGEFILEAQPIVSLNARDAAPHYEILVRMRDPSGEILAPNAFFSAAERYQLMPNLDRWVIGESLRQLEQYSEIVNTHRPVFSINLSGQSLQDEALISFVTNLIESSSIPAECLCFEITETAAIASMINAKRFIATMKRMGCQFSLDDFGAGLSSFAYLKTFDVDHLKIDGSFVQDITTNKVSESMVAAITQVAKVMGLKTIAEYVETDGVRACVSSLGVDYAQGFLFGEPCALEDALSGLSSHVAENADIVGAA